MRYPAGMSRGRPRTSDRVFVEHCGVLDIAKFTSLASCGDGELELTATLATGEVIDFTVETTTSRPYYGGQRYWLVCPRCSQRCAKLYTPGPFVSFACRP